MGAVDQAVKRIELEVLGTPAPQGSKRHVGNGVLIESSAKVAPWREAIVSEAIRSGIQGEMLDGPLLVSIAFYLPRPNGHRGAKGDLRPSARRRPHVKPDIDKLIRSTLDGLTQAGVISDDACVVSIGAMKDYADRFPPCAHIVVRELPDEVASWGQR